jgi:hypothetical protein
MTFINLPHQSRIRQNRRTDSRTDSGANTPGNYNNNAAVFHQNYLPHLHYFYLEDRNLNTQDYWIGFLKFCKITLRVILFCLYSLFMQNMF